MVTMTDELPPYPEPLPAIISRDRDGFTVVDRRRLKAYHAELADKLQDTHPELAAELRRNPS